MKSSESEVEEEEEEQEQENSRATQAALLVPGVLPSADVCGHCLNPECHAHRYGKFLAFLTLTKYNGDFNEEQEEIKTLFKQSYNTVREWDKVVKDNKGQAQVIDDEDMLECLPYCVLRFRNIWIARLKQHYNKANGTYAEQEKEPSEET